MKKTIKISIISILVLVLTIIGYYNIYTKKQWEVPGEVSKTLPSVTDTPKPFLGGKNIKQANTSMAFERPVRCMELMKKRSESTDFSGGLTGGEEDYLRDICRIPITRSLHDIISVLKWWKDEYGYENMMYVNIDELSGFLKIPGSELAGVVKPLKNIALNSKFPLLRERALIALHDITREKSIPTFIDRKKSIPIIKEVLRKEVAVRGVAKENRRVVYWAGEILAEEGEYEYAFPYLMKAAIFEISSKAGDKRALPYARAALNNIEEGLRLGAALCLVIIGDKTDNKRIIATTTVILRTSKDGGYQDQAIFILGELRDAQALPVLKKQLETLDPKKDYKYDNTLKAIRKIENAAEEKQEGVRHE